MKQSLRALLFLAIPTLTYAQDPVVSITDEEGNVVNETVVVCPSATWHTTDTVSLLASLTGDQDKVVNLRRYEVDVLEFTRNFFCWGVCYTSQGSGNLPVWESAHPVEMVTDSIFNNFHAYYKPQNQAGSSLFRFVWFDVANTDDSTWVDILFDAQVGVEENTNGVLGFEAYPNPAVDADVTVRFSLDPAIANASLVVYNALGSKVREDRIRGTNATAVIDRNELRPGVYFANVEVNGTALLTRRLVISSR